MCSDQLKLEEGIHWKGSEFPQGFYEHAQLGLGGPHQQESIHPTPEGLFLVFLQSPPVPQRGKKKEENLVGQHGVPCLHCP